METYIFVLHLAKIQYGLAQSLVRYIAGLCKIGLDLAHSFTWFWSNLQAMDVEKVRQAVGAIMKAQFDILEAYFRPGTEFVIIQNVDSAHTLHEAGCIPLSTRFGPARAVIDDVGARMHPPDASGEISPFTRYEYRSLRVHLLRGVGAPHAEMVACHRVRLDFCLRTAGRGHHYTTRAFAEPDELHRQAGEVEAAERLGEDFNFAAQWKAPCTSDAQTPC
ncbi:hypothetical protein DL769_010881 [Monosporascus sp. CRB-8-3]|nr:hypothetical protein DL769_010881 [Monosporascus sp. CRB-8-3]